MNDDFQPERTTWLRRRFSGSPRSLWCANVILLALASLWLFCDVYLPPRLGRNALEFIDWRSWGVLLLSGLVAANFLWLALGVWLGSIDFRRLRSMLVLVALLCLWMGWGLNVQSISWQGRRWRLAPYVENIDPLASSLLEKWPGEDGEREGLGPFMAYPIGQPTTLILLTPPEPFPLGPAIGSIERTADGGIRFELSDGGGKDWLEWRPAGEPTSHLGGLLEARRLTRVARLRGKWRLVRYRPAANAAEFEEVAELAAGIK